MRHWTGVSIQGVTLGWLSWEDAIHAACTMIFDDGGSHRIFFANAHTINLARRDASYRAILNAGDLVLNDGIGVSIAARLKGVRFPDNLNGTDFVPALVQHAGEERGIRIFVFGSVPGRARQAGAYLESLSPGVTLVGALDGYSHGREEVRRAIVAAKPDLLLVGLGNPLQEKWLYDWHECPVPLSIGVGALFDFLSGGVPRAPYWVRRLRCEWVFRLFLEPRRMFTRYVVGNVTFLANAVIDLRLPPSAP